MRYWRASTRLQWGCTVYNILWSVLHICCSDNHIYYGLPLLCANENMFPQYRVALQALSVEWWHFPPTNQTIQIYFPERNGFKRMQWMHRRYTDQNTKLAQVRLLRIIIRSGYVIHVMKSLLNELWKQPFLHIMAFGDPWDSARSSEIIISSFYKSRVWTFQ